MSAMQETDRRWLREIGVSCDEPAREPGGLEGQIARLRFDLQSINGLYDTLAVAYEKLGKEAAAAHQSERRLRKSRRRWRRIAVLSTLVWLAPAAVMGGIFLCR